MDQFDLQILSLLQRDGRISTAELGRKIGLSTTATKERVKKLEDEGVIESYAAIINQKAVGYGLTAFITIPVGDIGIKEMGDRLTALPEVTECHKVTGNTCFLIKVMVKDADHLEHLVDGINDYARNTYTYLALSTLKENGQVPISE
ncbi:MULTISPECIES: Lrp/AsnC family transcriptional regulator [unclassified Fusibacter]|uniref:Lrp/AsnC family transcriptional regulator n=1 Tax=unclassified Fusibacter TaxID=2624464 RepID=UPI0013E90207|nr:MULTISPECIES: Lrp/AsnC family transcriptional regulator [unclassified Fusibacter]MCK8059266.1 Lrp/AsnC family transcriptional regulator [Fusibacter sp. A2]NPE21270.1 Lrp/AsnC family transcriptional regulator [Fusibacter sp. A1]